MKFKKTVGVVTVLFFTLLAGCGGSNLSARLENGKTFLKEGSYLNAMDEFEKALKQDPQNCDANYGLLLANVLMLIDQTNAIIGLVSGLGGTLLPQYQGMVDQLISAFLMPFVEQFDQMDRYTSVIEEKGCSFDPGYIIIRIGTVDSPFLQVGIKGAWDPSEAQLIGAFANMAKGLLKIILSVDLDIPLDPVLSIINDPNSDLMDSVNSCTGGMSTFFTSCDIPGILRELGFVMDLTSTFLAWHPDRKYMFTEAAQEFSKGLSRISQGINGFFNDLQGDDADLKDAFYIYDADGDGKFSGLGAGGDKLIINAYKAYPASLTQDAQILDSEGRCIWSPALDVCVDSFLGVLYAFISRDYVSGVVNAMAKWAGAFDVRTIEETGSEPNPVHLTSLLSLIPSELGLSLPDVVRVKPWKLFASSVTENISNISGPRDWLPYWFDLDGDGSSELYVEGEWSEGSAIPSRMTDYVSAGDADHFVAVITDQDAPLGLTIPADCVFIEDSNPPTPETEGLIMYLAYRDPSFNGSLELNLSEMPTQCSNPCEDEIAQESVDGWYTPAAPETSSCGIYALNRVTGELFKTLTTFINNISGLIGGGGFGF